jgi:hypothetical protein
MTLAKTTFNRGKGGLSRPLTGEDHYSGLIFYSATLPAGFGSSDRIKQVTSLEDAETLGIVKGSAFDAFHYHVSEFFRANPKGVLWISINAVPGGAYDFTEITLMRDYSDGKVRQIGVFVTSAAYASSMLTTIQALVTLSQTSAKPISWVGLGADISAVTDLTTLADTAALTDPNVTAIIGQDGGGRGAALYVSSAKSVTTVGFTLGCVSRAKVSEGIDWVEEFPCSNGTELEVAAFANGQLYKDKESLADTLDTKGYIFLTRYVGVSGTYHNSSKTAVASTSDYCTIENNRTIDKAIRGVRAALVPKLNSPLLVNTNGTLTEDTIAYFASLAAAPITQMERDGELSPVGHAKNGGVLINPDQNVLSTSKLVITLKLVPVGKARVIEINIGFTLKLTA